MTDLNIGKARMDETYEAAKADATNNVKVLDKPAMDNLKQYNDRLSFASSVATTFDEARDLLLTKHRAYGAKNISNSPGGPLNGIRVRMHDKLARLNNLLDNPSGDDDGMLDDESLRDTLLDLANYSLIAVMVLDDGWPQA